VSDVIGVSPGEAEITLFNVKPAVGFTLPWAGVTPAPSTRKDAGLRPCSNGFVKLIALAFGCRWIRRIGDGGRGLFFHQVEVAMA